MSGEAEVREALAPLPRRVAGSDEERRAANALARLLRDGGARVEVQPVRARAGVSSRIAAHCLLSLAGGLLALAWPPVGALVALLAAASFYLDRAGRSGPLTLLFPTRASQNVIADAPEEEGRPSILLLAGYDVPSPARSAHEQVGPLARLLPSGAAVRATPARLGFWLGAVPVLACTMLRLGSLDGLSVDLLQMLASALLLTVVAVLADRALAGPADEASAAAAALAPEAAIGAWRELTEEGILARLALVGADELQAAGAAAFFGSAAGDLKGVAAIDLLPPFLPAPSHTAGEGELLTLPSGPRLAEAASGHGSSPVIAVATTAAAAARRAGLPAISVAAPTAEEAKALAVNIARAAADGI